VRPQPTVQTGRPSIGAQSSGRYDDCNCALRRRSWVEKSALLECCDLHLTAKKRKLAPVTTMVPVTTPVRSGPAFCFTLVTGIVRVVCYQLNPVGSWSARRIPNRQRQICTRYRLKGRLHGNPYETPREDRMPTRTAYSVVSDYPSRPSWGSRLVICVLKKPHNPLKVLIVADQITTHE
jgi:hypothetical protein